MRTWCVFMMAIFTPAAAAAQTDFTGTWQASGAPPQSTWKAVLRVEGRRVIGAVSECASVPPVELSDGHIDGDTVRFRCTNPIGTRRIGLTGRLNGNEIDFTADVEVLGGPGAETPITAGRFADSASRSFTAHRVPDGDDRVTDLGPRTG